MVAMALYVYIYVYIYVHIYIHIFICIYVYSLPFAALAALAAPPASYCLLPLLFIGIRGLLRREGVTRV